MTSPEIPNSISSVHRSLTITQNSATVTAEMQMWQQYYHAVKKGRTREAVDSSDNHTCLLGGATQANAGLEVLGLMQEYS